MFARRTRAQVHIAYRDKPRAGERTERHRRRRKTTKIQSNCKRALGLTRWRRNTRAHKSNL